MDHTQLKQNWDAERVERWTSKACLQYPELEPYQAIIAYLESYRAPDFFPLNKDGDRYVWRTKLDYFEDKDERGPGYFAEVGEDSRRFYLRKGKVPMRYINRPKERSVSAMIAHPNERQWNLPKYHKRHFMSFPLEIREQILEWALVPGSAAVQPFTITSNWKTEWRSQRHEIQKENNMGENNRPSYTRLTSTTRFTKCHDEDGEYTEHRNFRRAAIDATCLRTCKNFRDIGMLMLYSKNNFYFVMCIGTMHRSPPTLLLNGNTVRPNPKKPEPASDPQTLRSIQTGISEIRNQTNYTTLIGWVYYDPFLRFLHTIGPKNFTLIKSLKFSGMVKLHHCGPYRCNCKCSDDLVASLETYIPIITSLLPNLVNMTIYAAKDNIPLPDDTWNNQGPPTFEDRLSSLLEKEIRTISSLKVLEVLDASGEILSLAESTVTWFKERAAKRAQEKLLANLAEQRATMVGGSNVHCGFCGEGHVWAECYNLCNFCGGFGHFRKACPAVMAQL